MIKIPVSASRNYNVIMQHGALDEAGAFILEALGLKEGQPHGKKICIVTDANVDFLYGHEGQPLWKSLEEAGFDICKFVFAGGEKTKTMQTVSDVLNFLADRQFTRSDVLLALGGGIVGDVTGFAAATFMRGIEFIQVPTTLLATVDSSVGGKTGVNLDAGKNLAGAFWQPSLVLFDPDTLSTLSYDLKLDGVAEAIKAGLIADSSIIDMINSCDSLEDDVFLTELAGKAVKVKRHIVEEDEKENGVRQLLNFGHTIAHAIEKCSSYGISHGHAVAIGMAIVSAACDKLEWSSEKCAETVLALLNKFKFPLGCPYSPEELTEAALQDKKRRGSEITIVLPEFPAKCTLKKIPVEELGGFIACGIEELRKFTD